MYCTQCEESFYDTVKICPVCGSTLESPDSTSLTTSSKQHTEPICTACRHTNREGAMFCEMCASPLTTSHISSQSHPHQRVQSAPKASLSAASKKTGSSLPLILIIIFIGLFIFFGYSTNFGQMRDAIDSFLGRSTKPSWNLKTDGSIR